MRKVLVRNLNKALRKTRSRAGFIGTPETPRLSIFRSNKYIYAQMIDDVAGKTLASASTRAHKGKKITKTEAAKVVGAEIAAAAKKLGVKSLVLHRGSSRYHGRVRAVAEAVREGGVKI